MKSRPTTRLALGRVHCLGEIYDAVEDKFDNVLAIKDLSKEYISEMDFGGMEHCFVMDDIYSEKFEKIGIEPELKISFLADLVRVEGSGRYLNECKKDCKTLSYSVIFKIKTKKQSLNVLRLKEADLLSINLIKLYSPTHLVTGISWGANIVATFELSTEDISCYLEFEDSVRAFARMAAMDISGTKKIENVNKEAFYNKKLRIKIFSDIGPCNRLITDLNGFKNFMLELPNLIKEINEGKGVPTDYFMIPVEMLSDKNNEIPARPIREINEQIVNKIVRYQEQAFFIEAQLNDLLQECSRYEKIFRSTIRYLNSTINMQFKSTFANFKNSLKNAVVNYRSSEEVKEGETLEKVIEEYFNSDFYHDKVRDKIKELKSYCLRKINLFDRFSRFKCRILSADDNYDEAFTSKDKNKIYILYTHMSFFENNSEAVYLQHGFFFDLMADPKLKDESFFYVIDYETNEKLYKLHKQPELPKISFYSERKLVSEDYYHQTVHLNDIKIELKPEKKVDDEIKIVSK